MNWRSDPPNGWTALYRIAMMALLIGLYFVVAHFNGGDTMVGRLIEWLLVGG